VKTLAMALPAEAYQSLTWRKGSNTWRKGVVEKNVQASRRQIWLDAQKQRLGSFAV
jgi:hypothetical protein